MNKKKAPESFETVLNKWKSLFSDYAFICSYLSFSEEIRLSKPEYLVYFNNSFLAHLKIFSIQFYEITFSNDNRDGPTFKKIISNFGSRKDDKRLPFESKLKKLRDHYAHIKNFPLKAEDRINLTQLLQYFNDAEDFLLIENNQVNIKDELKKSRNDFIDTYNHIIAKFIKDSL